MSAPDPANTTQTASYSTVIYDITDPKRSSIISMVGNQSNAYSVTMIEDTSGGTRDDGTAYGSKTIVRVTREWGLGSGDTGVDGLSDFMVQLPIESGRSKNDFMRDILDRFEE